MRAIGIVTLFIAIVGCQSYNLAVTLTVPHRYREHMRSVKFEVLSLGAHQRADCDQAAFGELALGSSRLEYSKEVTVGGGGSAVQLTGIERHNPKLLLAYVRDLHDRTLAVGCAALNDPISGSLPIALDVEPTTHAQWLDTGGVALHGIDTRLPRQVVIEVIDALGEPLKNSAVRWRVLNSGDDTPAGNIITSSQGVAGLVVDVAVPAGPAVLEVRSRWSTDTPLALRTLVPPTLIEDAATADLVFTGDNMDVGHIGPNGQMGYAGLAVHTQGGPVTAYSPTHVGYRFYDPSSETWQGGSILMANGGSPMALVVVPATPKARIILIFEDAWKEVDIGSNTIVPLRTWTPPDNILSACRLGPCHAHDSAYILVELGDPSMGPVRWEVFTPDGEPPPVDHPLARETVEGRIAGCGCVATGNTSTAAVVEIQSDSWKWLLGTGVASSSIPGSGSFTVGFASPTLAAEAQNLWIADLDLNGVSAHEVMVASSADALWSTKQRSTELLQLPFGLAGGALNHHPDADLVALSGVGTSAGDLELYLQLSVVNADGVALSGSMSLGRWISILEDDIVIPPLEMSSDLPPAWLTGLWLADFTADGRDDVLVLSGWCISVTGSQSYSNLRLFAFDD